MGEGVHTLALSVVHHPGVPAGWLQTRTVTPGSSQEAGLFHHLFFIATMAMEILTSCGSYLLLKTTVAASQKLNLYM